MPKRDLEDPSIVVDTSVTEAYIYELAFGYRELIKRTNQLRGPENQLRGMTYASFVHVVKFARLLGLIELVRDDPPEVAVELFQIRNGKNPEVVPSMRRLIRLTPLGIEEELAWGNLKKYWQESLLRTRGLTS